MEKARRSFLRTIFAEGEIGGTLCMRSHISVHCATIKYFSNSFIFKNKIEKEGLPRDSTPALGAGGPEFKSRRPDQNISRVFFGLLKGLWNFVRQERLNWQIVSFRGVRRMTNVQNTGEAGVLFRNY